MQGPSAYQVIQAQQIVITGPGTPGNGLFVYNGAEALGNLIAQIVAPGVTLDPVGNSVNAVLNVGKWSPAGALLQHMGVDLNGNVYVADNTGATRILIANGGNLVWAQMEPAIIFYNASGAIIQVVDPQRGGNFQYQDLGTSSQGTCIGSQVGKNTTDPINGTTQNAGINIIDPAFADSLHVVGANISFSQVAFTKTANDSANTGSTNQGPFRSVAAPEQGVAGHVVQRWYGFSPDGTRGPGALISLTDPPTRSTAAVLELQGDEAFTGVVTPAAPPAGFADLYADVAGMLRMLTGLAGDTNNYFLAYNMVSGTSMPQTITSVTPSFTTVNNCSFPVGIGKYAFRVRMTYDGSGATGQPEFQFTAPATSSRWMNALFLENGGAGFSDAQNAALSFVTGPVLSTSARDVMDLEGEATFTAAGTLTLQVAKTSGGSNVIVQQVHFWLYPLV